MARILLATGDSVLFDIIDAEATGSGHETVWAVDGAETLEMAAAGGYLLVLLDTNLPVHTGPEACELLRADPGVPGLLPIYLMSDDDLNPHMLDKAGATGRFPKTHAANDLNDLVARHLDLEAALEPEYE